MADDNNNVVKMLNTGGDDCSRLEMTVCTVCQQMYTDPRVLPCLHTFCLKCLQKQDPVFPGSASCPLCSTKYQGMPTDLPKNHFVAKLMKVSQIASAAAKQRTPCDVCRPEDATTKASSPSYGADVMATHYCLNCAESLCDRCCAMHSRIRSSRLHRVVQLGTELTSQDLRGPTSQCDQHVDEPLKMFCVDCARCICFLCYAEHHTGHRCQDVNKVADKYNSELDRIVDRARAQLAEQFVDAEQLEKRRDQFIAQLHQHETAVQQKASRLKFLIDLHANELMETISDLRDVGLKNFTAAKREMEKCHQLTDGFRRYAQEVRDKGTVSDVIGMTASFDSRIVELERQHGEHHSTPYLFDDVTFVSYNVQQVLVGEKINNMVGKIDCKNPSHSATDDTSEPGNKAGAGKTLPVARLSDINKGTKTFQISAKGSLIVRDCTDDGKCITIENTGTKTQFLGGWTLSRSIDGNELIRFFLPRELTVTARTKLRLWCLGSKPAGDSATDVETTQKTWGVGANIITRLLDQAGEECAAHHQKMTTA